MSLCLEFGIGGGERMSCLDAITKNSDMKKIRLYDYQRDMLRDIINMLTAQSLQFGEW